MEILGRVVPQTMANEEYVAVKKIAQLSDGYSDRQVAMIWNGSLGGSEKPVAKKGVNKWHVAFNTMAYADTVINNLSK